MEARRSAAWGLVQSLEVGEGGLQHVVDRNLPCDASPALRSRFFLLLLYLVHVVPFKKCNLTLIKTVRQDICTFLFSSQANQECHSSLKDTLKYVNIYQLRHRRRGPAVCTAMKVEKKEKRISIFLLFCF